MNDTATAESPDVASASGEVAQSLTAVTQRLDAIASELLDACVERTRQEGIVPTVHDAACLGIQATTVLTIWNDDLQEAIWDRRLERARAVAGIEVAPALPNERPSFQRGRDLSVWYVPGDEASVGRTTDQAAYLLQVAVLSRLDAVVDEVLGESDGLDDDTVSSVRQVAAEHLKWWLSPGFTRHNVEGWVRCQSCEVELNYLNCAEVGSVVEECRMCRGWFTQEQRHEQHRQKQREWLKRVARQ